ncbi:hypothetical protein [Olleya aquimaris]|uniref:Uncharacterized protein n=1 Tax=Olleya aquimaris TaxID=639310 RepID=A0A327RGV5_9FLAO|nr:hypothetical protein [Olleya aquimaris]RAJ12957.1 hypothetical protein LY08_02239 [Olleya aquimaris]
MQLNGLIYTFPKEIKALLVAFVVVLSVGFFTGLLFVNNTSSVNPTGIEEQYLGNEKDVDASVMKFKKTEKQMLNIVHSHILSMALIFFLMGLILATTQLNYKLKVLLMVEPFLSVIVTFGGLYLLWKGMTWMKYIVMISGTLMTLSYLASALIILKQLLLPKKTK